jgi:hypothetical protein
MSSLQTHRYSLRYHDSGSHRTLQFASWKDTCQECVKSSNCVFCDFQSASIASCYCDATYWNPAPSCFDIYYQDSGGYNYYNTEMLNSNADCIFQRSNGELLLAVVIVFPILAAGCCLYACCRNRTNAPKSGDLPSPAAVAYATSEMTPNTAATRTETRVVVEPHACEHVLATNVVRLSDQPPPPATVTTFGRDSHNAMVCSVSLPVIAAAPTLVVATAAAPPQQQDSPESNGPVPAARVVVSSPPTAVGRVPEAVATTTTQPRPIDDVAHILHDELEC